MRATCALGLIFLFGCAAGVQHPGESVLNPGPEILRVNGTFEPVTFAAKPRQVSARVQRPHESIVTPKPKVLHVNGTFAPEAFVLNDTQKIVVMNGREACQTNDPMPVGRMGRPLPQMPSAPPLRVAPMPNACPVTVPWTRTTVFTTVPRAPKTVPVPAPTEPRP